MDVTLSTEDYEYVVVPALRFTISINKNRGGHMNKQPLLYGSFYMDR